MKYWIALSMVNGIGEVLTKNLYSKFNNAKDIFEAEPKELIKVEGIGERNVQAIKNFKGWSRVEREISKIDRYGFKLLTLNDPEYPRSLKRIYNPPPFLYEKGVIIPRDEISIAIVGTRTPDRYGRQVTETLAGELGALGITIVSGMARGVDSIAHSETIKRGGRTIGVMGSGIDVVYPPENRRLYKAISENGAIISEFSLGTEPHAHNFPQRNRIISGLSLGVIVVQASAKSGSLISASFALDQNKEVFAVPGNIGKHLSRGTNWLIKKGAKLVETVDDVLGEVEQLNALHRKSKPEAREDTISLLSGREKAIYSVLKAEPLHVDNIIKLSGTDSSIVLSTLLSLELNGYIRKLPGMLFQIRN